ncbi:MAG TPA: YciI family protein [Gaiellaceae bacterium]|nr:YciI family protein [Gaiellaceae bacterium]
MQYLLLINDDPSSVGEDLMPEYMAFTEALRASGSFVGANQLQPVETATTVRVRDGETFVTDGPFIETKETLGGYYLIEAESLDEALEWAAKIPSARYGHIEVRPVVMRPAEVEA